MPSLQEIQDLASSERLEEALRAFVNAQALQKQEKLRSQVLQLIGNLQDIEEEKDLGLLTGQEYLARKAGIRRGLLSLLQKVINGEAIVLPPESPFILAAFANDPEAFLESLHLEEKEIREVLDPLHRNKKIELLSLGQTNKDELYRIFTHDYRGKINLFHYGGHSDLNQLGLPDLNPAEDPLLFFLELFLSQEAMKLIFLNGCANHAIVRQLLEESRLSDKAIIATSAPLDDNRARDFARQFYTSLAGGARLQAAFAEARMYLGKRLNDSQGKAFRFLSAEKEKISIPEFPWALYYQDPEVLQWQMVHN